MTKSMKHCTRRMTVLLAVLIIICCAAAFSEWAYGEISEVPVLVDIPAVQLDFIISESVNMTRGEKPTDLIIDAVTITNSGSEDRNLYITEVTVIPDDDWNIVPADTDFSSVHDNRIFSIVTAGHDFAEGEYREIITVSPGQSESVIFSGKTGTFSENIREQAAVITVTIEGCTAETIQEEI